MKNSNKVATLNASSNYNNLKPNNMQKTTKVATLNAEEQKLAKEIVKGFKEVIAECQVYGDGHKRELLVRFPNKQSLIIKLEYGEINAKLYYPTSDRIMIEFPLRDDCNKKEFKKLASAITRIVMDGYLTDIVEEFGLDGWTYDLKY